MSDEAKPNELAKAYEPAAIEEKWARFWAEERLFDTAAPAPGDTAKPFTMLLPPPNVTGRLHMGHMLNQTEMDILTRWHRMSGERALWVPGTDHAGIATQMMVEKQLAAEGKTTRKELGREAFTERVWAWKQQYGGAITDQMRRLGASVDWSREYFTMDDDLSAAVVEAFVRLYEQGLVYRGAYIVNWDPVLQSAVSDLEVENEERLGKLYHVRYPLADGSGSIVIATTRPETMLGDTAVAVNPTDERYTAFIGKMLALPLTGREIPVIADDWANPEFGTGAVKVTPAHDPNDFAIGQRHCAAQPIAMLDVSAKVDLPGSKYHGLDRFAAREAVVADLEAAGLLVAVKDHAMTVPVSQRSGSVIEPRLSDQWFLRSSRSRTRRSPPCAKATSASRRRCTPRPTSSGWATSTTGASRASSGGAIASRHGTAAPARPSTSRARRRPCVRTCGSADLVQETDVLDTWFSSGLLPFTVFGWPEVQGVGDRVEGVDAANLHPTPYTLHPDLSAFYPTDLLVTGFDILFFWVARMIMLGTHFMLDVPMPDGTPRTLADAVPFREVYIHALVRDANREKMSKTKGNVIDPIDIIGRFGTDAVRFTLASMASPGTDIAFSEARTEGYRAFANKIWNAARFLLMNLDRAREAGIPVGAPHLASEMWAGAPIETRWILSRLAATCNDVDHALARVSLRRSRQRRLSVLLGRVLRLVSRTRQGASRLQRRQQRPRPNSRLPRCITVYEGALRLLSPFMPFITEEIWHALYAAVGVPSPAKSIALTRFPQAHDYPQDLGCNQRHDAAPGPHRRRARGAQGDGRAGEGSRAHHVSSRPTRISANLPRPTPTCWRRWRASAASRLPRLRSLAMASRVPRPSTCRSSTSESSTSPRSASGCDATLPSTKRACSPANAS